MNNRGVRGGFIAFDEFEFGNKELITTVIMPLFENRNTAFAGVTTPLGTQTMRTELESMKTPQGKNIFISKNVGLLCAKCESRGIMDCRHVDVTPAWKDEQRGSELMAELYKNDPQKRKRETKGIATDASTCYFRGELIERMKNNERLPMRLLSPDYPFVFTTVDPGGTESLTAICSAVRMNGSVQVSTRGRGRVFYFRLAV